MGLWYDAYRLPNIFLSGVKCDNTTYTLNPNGSVAVLEEAVDAQGQSIVDRELARVIDPDVPGAFILLADGGKCIFPAEYPSQR